MHVSSKVRSRNLGVTSQKASNAEENKRISVYYTLAAAEAFASEVALNLAEGQKFASSTPAA